MNILPLIALACLTGISVGQTRPAGVLAVNATLKIGGEGRWDYVTVGDDHLLYVTRSSHTQVIDPASGKTVADVKAGSRLHGTAVVAKANRAFVTDGGDGKLIVFDLKTHQLLGKIDAADDADGIIYDAGSDRVLVSCGDAGKMLSLDPGGDLKSAKCESVELGGKPEFLAADGKGRAFVCINDKNEIAVVDLAALKVIQRWKIGAGTAPTGLAIDAKNQRLFVGCRNQKLEVLDTGDGHLVAELPIGSGNDACAFDVAAGLAFASCGDGTLAVIRETPAGKYEVAQSIRTEPGARTLAVDPSTHELYLPTADFAPAASGKRPAALPDTFKILVVGSQQ